MNENIQAAWAWLAQRDTEKKILRVWVGEDEAITAQQSEVLTILNESKFSVHALMSAMIQNDETASTLYGLSLADV